MHSFSILLSLALPFLASGAPTSIEKRIPSDAPVLVSDSWAALNTKWIAVRPDPTYKINRWTNTIPDTCYREAVTKANENNLVGRCTDVANLSVFEVTYSDAAKPWLFCRCKNSGESEADMIQKVGKVPPAIRQHSRYIMSFKGEPNSGTGATVTWEGDIIIYGTKMAKTYLHEMAHQIDIRSLNDGLSPMYTFEYSSRSDYATAAQKDTCFVSNYARDSLKSSGKYTEGWAEVFMYTQMIFDIGNDKVPNWSCAQNAILTAMSQTISKTKNYSTSVHLPYGERTIKRDNLPQARIASVKAMSEKEDPDYAIISDHE